MKPLVLAAGLVIGMGGVATAQSPATPPPPLPPPVAWTAAPDAAAIGAAYPRAAFDAGASGRVVLECALTSARLEACRVVSEHTPGVGFGAAALGLVGEYRAEGAADQLARVTLEWRHPRFQQALTAFEAGDFAAVPELAFADVSLVRRPSGDDVGRSFPDRAMRMGLEGRGEALCFIDIGGALTRCVVVAETPPDYDFGLAAARVGQRMRVAERSRMGELTAGRSYRVKVWFRLPNGAARETPAQ